ncbi:hypothetical protein LCGC14_0867160 [marine sediment metagenome]|uniref:Nucleoside 2-deoxyribosyltransferase like n=1 Tax=marine sediment metagenome TaxID=412755 RepID=A0A0F9RQC9_9ZZZZ
MAKVITAVEPLELQEFSIFLAGAIDMGNAVDWQSYVIDELSEYDDLVIVNPRRPNFTADTLDEQIHWELKALEDVDLVFMWFPKSAKAPISFLETGLYLKSNKIVIGAEDEFYRQRNLEITSERYGTPLFNNLNVMIIETLIRKANRE